MEEISIPKTANSENDQGGIYPHPPELSFPLKWIAEGIVLLWRMGVDWPTRRPIVVRVTAHSSIIILALVAILLSGISLPPQEAVGGNLNPASASVSKSAAPPQQPSTPTPALNLPASTLRISNALGGPIVRQPSPHTIIPGRLRPEVIVYTVQAGDTIFDIADRFGLTPETIVWSNREALQDAPWLIQLGLELFILPVDGTYHTVLAGETVESIAEKYDVEPEALYNEWNDLEEDTPLQEGQLLVIPGGKGDEIAWTPPQPEYATSGSAQYSYGVCSGVTFTGPGANGWFILPTGSSRVSGWYFRDPRNPGHIGLDYACRLGDPIYAADNGVVTIAGWNGGYGILAEVNHGNGFVTRYGHFSDIVVGCGQAVYQGQLLGYCGSTGWSTGPHLHFEIRYNGIPQDPQAYLP